MFLGALVKMEARLSSAARTEGAKGSKAASRARIRFNFIVCFDFGNGMVFKAILFIGQATLGVARDGGSGAVASLVGAFLHIGARNRHWRAELRFGALENGF